MHVSERRILCINTIYKRNPNLPVPEPRPGAWRDNDSPALSSPWGSQPRTWCSLRCLLGPSAYDIYSSVNQQEWAAARMTGARKGFFLARMWHSGRKQHHDCTRPLAHPSGNTNQDPSYQESLVFSTSGSCASFTGSVILLEKFLACSSREKTLMPFQRDSVSPFWQISPASSSVHGHLQHDFSF